MISNFIQNLVLSIAVLLPWSVADGGSPPVIVGTIKVSGEGFRQTHTHFLEPSKNYFLEINYDGVSPLTVNTRLTTDPLDTMIAVYDETGMLLDINDDVPGSGNARSELRFFGLPAGQYFMGIGLVETIFESNFVATSNSKASGTVIVEMYTEVFPLLPGARRLDLNYNFNGIVHTDEPSDPTVNPDDPNGFRSISDQSLDFRNGIPSHPVLNRYEIVAQGGQLDVVHVGNRNTVDGGMWAFDAFPDSDASGVQPDWLPDPNQTGRQETFQFPPVPLVENSQMSFLYQISNGGGDFKVVFDMKDIDAPIYTCYIHLVPGPDWTAANNGQPNIGAFPASTVGDLAFPDPLNENSLLISEAVIHLGQFAGFEVLSVTFKELSNPNAGLVVLAANLTPGCLVGDINADGDVNLLDVQPFVQGITSGVRSCENDLNGDGSVNLLDVGPFIEVLTGG